MNRHEAFRRLFAAFHAAALDDARMSYSAFCRRGERRGNVQRHIRSFVRVCESLAVAQALNGYLASVPDNVCNGSASWKGSAVADQEGYLCAWRPWDSVGANSNWR